MLCGGPLRWAFAIVGLILEAAAFQQTFGRTGYFWHIDSLHFDANYTVTGDRTNDCWQNDKHPSILLPQGEFGDYWCDSPPKLVEETLAFMRKTMGDKVDFILWTGNSVPQSRGFPFHSSAAVDQVLERVTDLFRHNFPYTTVYPTLGNLDMKPKGSEKRRYGKVAELWQNWLPPRAVESLQRGGYYMIELAGRRLRLVALNMNLYVHHRESVINYQEKLDPDPEHQFQWLAGVMEKAKRKRQNVILFGHTPPGKYERVLTDRGHQWLEEGYNRKYLDLVRQYSDIIVAQFFGHQHSDTFRIFTNERQHPVSWALLNPSVSPRKVAVMNEASSSNPSVRLYRYDTFTGEIFDYVQYYLDLEEANAKGEAKWKTEYNFTTKYRTPELYDAPRAAAAETVPQAVSNVKTGSDVTDQLPAVSPFASTINTYTLSRLAGKISTDDGWFDRYYRANSVGYEGPWICQPSTRCRHINRCAITNVDYNDYQYCVTGFHTGTVSSRAGVNGHPVLMAIIALGYLAH